MTVKEFYETTHGDYQAALTTMMMDDFIKRMLGKFVQTSAAPAMFEAYEKKDYPAVFAAAHSLKGVTGNLALTSLFNKIVPIVEATRNVDAGTPVDIDEAMKEYKKEYEFIIAQINILLAA